MHAHPQKRLDTVAGPDADVYAYTTETKERAAKELQGQLAESRAALAHQRPSSTALRLMKASH